MATTPTAEVTRQTITQLVSAATGTGTTNSAIFCEQKSPGIDSGTLRAQCDTVGSFSGLTLNLTVSLDGGTTFSNVGNSWSPLTSPVQDFPISETPALYQFSVATFVGGTSITVYGMVAPIGPAEISASITGGNAAASATGSAVPADADYIGFNSGGNLVGVSSANPLPVTTTVSISGTLTDGSSTVTTGGTSQQIFASNASRKFLLIQNPVSATEVLFINFTTAASTSAGTSIQLSPGGSIQMDSGGYVSTEAINVTAATTGHAYIAKQG